MSPSTQIFARKFKVKHFTSKFTNTKVKRNDEVIEYSNFFKFRFDWEAKYHFELFLFNDPIDGRHYLVVYLYLVCPPVLLKNEEQFYLKMATLNDKHEKKHEKGYRLHLLAVLSKYMKVIKTWLF